MSFSNSGKRVENFPIADSGEDGDGCRCGEKRLRSPQSMKMVVETNEKLRVLRVLIVEDTAERQQFLQSLFREHAWVLVHTAARAIRLIKAFDFDLISLDYDLSGPGKGDEVAKAQSDSRNANAPVLVHAMNSTGAAGIAEILPQAAIVPIASIMKSNATVKRIREALRNGVPSDWRRLMRDG